MFQKNYMLFASIYDSEEHTSEVSNKASELKLSVCKSTEKKPRILADGGPRFFLIQLQLCMLPSVLYCLKTCGPVLDKRIVHFLVNINIFSTTSCRIVHFTNTISNKLSKTLFKDPLKYCKTSQASYLCEQGQDKFTVTWCRALFCLSSLLKLHTLVQ